MFCPKCGTNLPDNARFCGQCGTTIEADPAPQATYAQPVFEMPEMSWIPPEAPAPVYADSKPVKRGNLITAIGRRQTRVFAIISLVVFLLCLGLTVADYFIVKSTPLSDMPAIPVAELIIDEELDVDEMVDDLMDEMGMTDGDVDVLFDEANTAIAQTQLNKKDRKALENLLNSAEDLLNQPSLGNLQAVAGHLDKTADIMDDLQSDLIRQKNDITTSPQTRENCVAALEFVDYAMDVYDETEDLPAILMLTDLALWGLLGLALLFILLAGFFRLPGLLVPSILLFLPLVLALGSVVWFAISLAAHILLWVMLAIVNKKHKATQHA